MEYAAIWQNIINLIRIDKEKVSETCFNVWIQYRNNYPEDC